MRTYRDDEGDDGNDGDDDDDDDGDDECDANEGVRQMWSEPESWSLRLQPHLSGTKVSISVMITMIVTTILMMIAIIGGILGKSCISQVAEFVR